MARGNQGQVVFRDDRDRKRFLATLGEACGKTGWIVHAYVLMGNHYHLLIQTPEGNLVAGMKWLQGTYTQRFNRRHGVSGHLFQGRYKAVVVEAENAGYWEVVSTYIHLNPARAGLIRDRPGAVGRVSVEQLSLLRRAGNSAISPGRRALRTTRTRWPCWRKWATVPCATRSALWTRPSLAADHAERGGGARAGGHGLVGCSGRRDGRSRAQFQRGCFAGHRPAAGGRTERAALCPDVAFCET